MVFSIGYHGQSWKLAFVTESGMQLHAKFSNNGAGAPMQVGERAVLEFPHNQTTIITVEADDVI